jgi:hypothetical protein
VIVQQCPDPERLLALAGQERVLEHNWGAGLLRPPRLGQGPHGGAAPHRPEQIRQAQPGEAWVIQAGQSIHRRVLPPPAVTVSRSIWRSASRSATTPWRCRRSSSRLPWASRRPPPMPAGLGVASVNASGIGGSGPGGYRRQPGGPGCPCGPCQGGAGDDSPHGDPGQPSTTALGGRERPSPRGGPTGRRHPTGRSPATRLAKPAQAVGWRAIGRLPASRAATSPPARSRVAARS